ncbi:unnamed protein product [Heligmosomoides polygyrus]|uniref:HMG box domain-containing protein n=1 Tax=Heligmosomoides polygyrus TaxID=6339 RepID=A0A183F3C2_HELPZ|nr:unnamed protein product [Heligmosomoides polygyrus]
MHNECAIRFEREEAVKTTKEGCWSFIAQESEVAEKRKKDPNGPERALSTHMLWLNEMRPKFTKPGMSVVDFFRPAGVHWATVKDKSRWEKMAAEGKKRYEKMAGGSSR